MIVAMVVCSVVVAMVGKVDASNPNATTSLYSGFSRLIL